MLKQRQQHYPFIVFEDFFRAIAMVHIKIQNGHPLNTMFGNRMHRTHSNVIEETKTHGFAGFRMVAGWANGAKCIRRLLVHHHVYRFDHSTCRMSRRSQSARIHGRIGVHTVSAHCGLYRFQILNILGRMHPRQLACTHCGRIHLIEKIKHLCRH